MSGRDIKKLDEVATIIVGLAFKSKYFNVNGDGIRLVRGVNITNRNLRWGNDTRWWDNLSDDLNRYYLKDNDIVIGMDGSLVGKNYAKISLTDLPLLLVQRVACVRAKEGIYPQFIWYCISNSRFENYIDAVKTGTTIPHISSKQIGEYSINLPCYEDQKKIASILSSLDDKIELNTRMNKVLEETSRVLFHRWFVEFEFPNTEGKPYKSAGGKMVESKMGRVPEGWIVGKLRDIIDLSYGKPLKEENRSGNGFPVFGANGGVGWHNEWMVDGPGIIVGRKGNPGTVTWSHENFFPIDTTFFVCPFMSKYGRYGFHYLYLLLNTLNLPHLTSDSAVPGLNKKTALTQKILIPNIYIVNKFELVISSIFSQTYALELENKSLISLRNILLPKLMSGELQLPENKISGNNLLQSELSKVMKNGF